MRMKDKFFLLACIVALGCSVVMVTSSDETLFAVGWPLMVISLVVGVFITVIAKKEYCGGSPEKGGAR